MGWQRRLDKALLDVDAKPTTRLRNLRKVLENPGVVLQDLGRAAGAIADKGFKDGHVEAIDLLWPTGTMARADLEGLQALRKQLPEVAEDLRTSPPQRAERAGPRPGLDIAAVASGLVGLATDPQKRQELADEATNALRPKPRGLETPTYDVVEVYSPKGSGFGRVELRRYKPFTVASTDMPGVAGAGLSSGQGFMTLADYLFGKNAEDKAMQMTAPVEISYDGGGSATMSFVLPKAAAESPPAPEERAVKIALVPERLVLVKVFPGVVTDGEVERQRAILSGVLEAEGLRPVNVSQYSILQYNSPFTIPWRRRNEMAIVVERPASAQNPEAGPEPADDVDRVDPSDAGAGPANATAADVDADARAQVRAASARS